MTTTEETDLHEIQARLLRSRRAIGLNADGTGPIARAPQHGQRCDGETRTPSLADALEGLPPKGAYRCSGKLADGRRCNAEIPYPGKCPTCYAAVEVVDFNAKVADRLLRIPGEYRDASWAAIESGLPSRTGGPRVLIDVARVRRIRETLSQLPDGSKVVIVGAKSGVGKSTLAAAWLRAEMERGVENAWWVNADDLGSETVVDEDEVGVVPRDLLRRAESVVLDDLGAEIGAAQKETGLLAMRIEAACKALGARSAKNRGRLVITTALHEEAMGGVYGHRIARRIFDAAKVITIDGERS